jgi:hypothetical protein
MLAGPLALIISGSDALTPASPVKRKRCAEIMFESAVVKVSLTQQSELSFFCIEAVDGCFAIDDVSVDGVLKATETLLDRGEPFATLWDLRLCPVPSSACIFSVLKWAISNKARLDTANKRMAVVLPSTRPVILAVVRNVLNAFGPTCPMRATFDSTSAMSFLEDPK